MEAFRRPTSLAKTEPLTKQKAHAPIVNFVSSDPIPDSEEGEIRDGHPPGQQTSRPSTKHANDEIAAE
jgi:hypothetical protein